MLILPFSLSPRRLRIRHLSDQTHFINSAPRPPGGSVNSIVIRHPLLSSVNRITLNMAFRALATNSSWSIMGSGVTGKRSFAAAAGSRAKSGIELKGQFAPVYVMLGMVVVALTIGTHTAKQQLVHSPGVYVSKKKRESVPEVEDPDPVISSADKLINKSFLRKVAHIQDPPANQHDPIRADPFTRPRNSETLKSDGVEPRID